MVNIDQQRVVTWLYFMEGMAYIPLLFIVAHNIFIEIQKSKQLNQKLKRMYLKSIPFLVFICMLVAIIFRIATGIVAWEFNAKAPHYNKIVFTLYSWSVQFFTFQFLFIILFLMKLAMVYMDKNMHLERVVVVDRIIIGNAVVSLTFYTTIAIIVLVNGNHTANIDKIWRIYFIISCALIMGSLGFFGFRILKAIKSTTNTKGETLQEEMLVSKIKAVMAVAGFMGTVIWVVNLIYVTIGRDSNAEDYLNTIIYAVELVNCFGTSIIFGRSTICINIRVLLGFPESMVGTDSSKTSGSSGTCVTNDIALAVTHISTHFSEPSEPTKDDVEYNTSSQNIGVSSNSSVSN